MFTVAPPTSSLWQLLKYDSTYQPSGVPYRPTEGVGVFSPQISDRPTEGDSPRLAGSVPSAPSQLSE